MTPNSRERMTPRAQTCYPTRALLFEYEQFREHELTLDGLRALRETCDLIEMFLEERGVASVDTLPDAPRTAIGEVVSVDVAVEYLASFEREFVAAVVHADTRYTHVTGAIAQDFSRWLRARMLS